MATNQITSSDMEIYRLVGLGDNQHQIDTQVNLSMVECVDFICLGEPNWGASIDHKGRDYVNRLHMRWQESSNAKNGIDAT